MRIGCFLLFCGLCRGKTAQELEKNKSEVVEIRCRIVFSGGDLRSRKSFAGPFIRPADCYERLYLLKMRVGTPSLRGLGTLTARTGNLSERTGPCRSGCRLQGSPGRRSSVAGRGSSVGGAGKRSLSCTSSKETCSRGLPVFVKSSNFAAD